MSNSVKTILSIDDSDVKAKLKQLEAHYKSTYAGWAAATEKIKQKDQELIGVKGELAKMEAIRNEEKKKGAQADKTILAGMNDAIKAHKDTIRVLQAEKNEIKAVADAHNMEMQAVKKATAANKPYNESLEQQWNHMIRVLRWGGTLAGAYFALGRAWDLTIGKGVELGRQIEDMGMGISALTAANTSNISSTGAYLTSMDKFNRATAMTTETMKMLRKAAIETPASFSEMASIFQQAYVSTSKMGKGFGETVQDVTKNTVQLATRMANIAGAIGMPMEKALEETRSLMSGQASGDSLIASLLFGSPAQANEAMRKAKEGGPLAVKQMLDGVMESFDVLAGVDTYTKSLAQATGAYENLVTQLAAPVKNEMAKAFDGIAKALSDENIASAKETLGDIGDAMKRLGEVTVIAVGALATVKSVMYISAASEYATALLGAASATDALTAATKRNAIAMKMHPLAKMVGIATTLAEAQKDMEDEAKGKWKITSLQQESVAIEQLTTGMTKLAELRKDLGKRTIEHPFKVTKEDVKAQETLVRNLMQSVEAFNTKGKTKGTGGGAGGLTAQIDLEGVAETIKIIEKHKSKSLEISEDITKEEKKIAALRMSMAEITGSDVGSLGQKKIILNAIAKGEEAISALKKDQSELNAKAHNKAEVAAKKVAAEEWSVYQLKKQALEAELAQATYLESQKSAGYELDDKKLTDLQRLKLKGFDLTAEAQGEELATASKINNAKNRGYAIDVALEKIYKTLTEKEEYRLRLKQAQTDEIEKQEAIAGRLATQEMERYGKELLHGLKMQQASAEFEKAFGKDKIGATQGRSAIEEAMLKADFEAFGLSDEEAKKVYDKAESLIQKIESRIAEIPPLELDLTVKGWDEFSNALASISNNLVNLTNDSKKFSAVENEIADQLRIERKKEVLNVKEITRLETAKTVNKVNQSHKELQAYSALTGAVAGMFKAESKEAKALHEVQKGIAAAEMVMAVQAMVMDEAMTAKEIVNAGAKATANGVAAVAKALSSLPFPASLAAGAAMMAALVALGVSMSGGGGSSGAPVVDYNSKGTVLGGGAEGQSESFQNLTSLLESIHTSEYSELKDINRAVTTMAGSIENTVASMLKSGVFDPANTSLTNKDGITANGVGSVLNSMALLGPAGLAVALTPAITNALEKSGMVEGINQLFGSSATGINVGTMAINAINSIAKPISNALGSIGGALFGGGSSQKIWSQGFDISGSLGANTQSELSKVRAYSQIETTTDGGFFGGGKSQSYDTSYMELQDDTAKYMASIYKNISDSLHAFDVGFGTTVSDSIETMDVGIAKIELVGIDGVALSGEKQIEKITDYFNSFTDKATEQLFGAIVEPYQKVGEALTETAGRILIQKAVVTQELSDIGMSIGTNAIKVADELSAISGGLDKFTDSTREYYDKYFTDAEKAANSTKHIQEQFAQYGATMPKTTEEFRALVTAQDLTTESGQKAYVALLGVSGAFYDVTSAAEEARSVINDERKGLQETLDLLTGVTTERDIEISKLDDSNKALQRTIWALEDAKEAEDNRNKAIADSDGRIKSFIGSMTTLEDKSNDLNAEIGRNSVATMEELLGVFVQMSTDVDGLTEAENNALVANKNLIDSFKQMEKDFLALVAKYDAATKKIGDIVTPSTKQLSGFKREDLTSVTIDTFDALFTEITAAKDFGLKILQYDVDSATKAISDFTSAHEASVKAITDPYNTVVKSIEKQISSLQKEHDLRVKAIDDARNERLDVFNELEKYVDITTRLRAILTPSTETIAQMTSDIQSATLETSMALLDRLEAARDRQIDIVNKDNETLLDSLNTQKDTLSAIVDMNKSLRSMSKSIRDNVFGGTLVEQSKTFNQLFSSLQVAIKSGANTSDLLSDLSSASSSYADTIKSSAVSGAEYMYQSALLANQIETLVDTSASEATLTDLQKSIDSQTDALKLALESVENEFKNSATTIQSALQGGLSAAESSAGVAVEQVRFAIEQLNANADNQIKALDKTLEANLSPLNGSIEDLTTAFDLNIEELQKTFDKGISPLNDALKTATDAQITGTKAIEAQYNTMLTTISNALNEQKNQMITDALTNGDLFSKYLGTSSIVVTAINGMVNATVEQQSAIAQAMAAIALRPASTTVVNNIYEAATQIADAAKVADTTKETEKWVTSPTGVQTWESTKGAIGTKTTDNISIKDISGRVFTGTEAIKYVEDQLKLGNARGVYGAAIASGISANSLDALMAWEAGTSNKWAKENGLAEFKSGGYTGNMSANSIAGIVHGQEYVVNAQTTKDLGINNSGGVIKDLLDEIRSLKNLTVKLVADNTKQLQTQRAIYAQGESA